MTAQRGPRHGRIHFVEVKRWALGFMQGVCTAAQFAWCEVSCRDYVLPLGGRCHSGPSGVYVLPHGGIFCDWYGTDFILSAILSHSPYTLLLAM